MKKLLQILIGILLAIYITLSLVSWGDGYHAERDLWRINRQLSYIGSHLESTPDYTVNQLANRYRVYINKYSKTIYAKRGEMMLGDLYSLKKNFTQARMEYAKAVSSDQELSALAEINTGKTYEVEGNWDQALDVYKSVIRHYPLTQSGFFVPMYLATKSEMSYADALVFYQKIAAKHPKSKIEYNSLRMIALCYLNQKDWSAAVNTMGEIALKYPIGQALREAVNTINLLCVTKLHDYDTAINIYTQFIKKYPDHLADPLLKKMIKDLELLKSKKLILREAPHAVK